MWKSFHLLYFYMNYHLLWIWIIITWDACGRPHLKMAWMSSYSATCLSGFSFEAGGRTSRPVVSRSMSGTLMAIFEGFVLFFVITIWVNSSLAWETDSKKNVSRILARSKSCKNLKLRTEVTKAGKFFGSHLCKNISKSWFKQSIAFRDSRVLLCGEHEPKSGLWCRYCGVASSNHELLRSQTEFAEKSMTEVILVCCKS